MLLPDEPRDSLDDVLAAYRRDPMLDGDAALLLDGGAARRAARGLISQAAGR